MNIGEELTGAYLKYIKHCDFIEYNIKDSDLDSGEIDVAGIVVDEKTVYFCEVAIHLTTGLQYDSNKAENTKKIYKKFDRASKYATKKYRGYTHKFQLWSPVVKKTGTTSQMDSLQDAVEMLNKEGIEVDLIINEKYAETIEQLSDYAKKQTTAFENPAMRMLQILSRVEK